MKGLDNKLQINKKTVSVLDKKALSNVKGGAAAIPDSSCVLLSCNTKQAEL